MRDPTLRHAEGSLPALSKVPTFDHLKTRATTADNSNISSREYSMLQKVKGWQREFQYVRFLFYFVICCFSTFPLFRFTLFSFFRFFVFLMIPELPGIHTVPEMHHTISKIIKILLREN